MWIYLTFSKAWETNSETKETKATQNETKEAKATKGES